MASEKVEVLSPVGSSLSRKGNENRKEGKLKTRKALKGLEGLHAPSSQEVIEKNGGWKVEFQT